MSSPSNQSTLDSHRGETPPDPETRVDLTSSTVPQALALGQAPGLSPERQAKLLADYETTLREMAKDEEYRAKHHLYEKRIQILLGKAKKVFAVLRDMKTTCDEWPRAIGETQVWNGAASQKRGTVNNHFFENAAKYATWFAGNSAIGVKGSGPCVYDCLFVERGAPNKYACLASYTITIDFDSDIIEGEVVAAIRSWEEFEKVLAWIQSKGWGCKVHSTSSHNPAKGKWCLKIQIPCEPISYLERYAFGGIMHEEICELLGIAGKEDPRWKMVDPIIRLSIQLQHVPRWQTKAGTTAEDRQRQAILAYVIEGNAIQFDSYRAILADRQAKADQKKADAKKAVEAMEEARRQRGLPVEDPTDLVESTDLAAKLDRAEKLLAALGPAVEGQGGDTTTFKAIMIGKRCGLTLEQYLPLLLRWNATCSPPWSDSALESKARRGYNASRVEEGSALRRTFASPTLLDAVRGIQEIDLGADSDTEQTTSPVGFSEGGVTRNSLNKEKQNRVTPEDPVAQGARGKGGLFDRWWGGIANPTKVTALHQAALPVLTWEGLTCKLTVQDSPCGTQKTRSYTELVRYCLRLRMRVVIPVPSQSLSQDLANYLNEGLPKECRIQSHMDPVVDWTGSVVCCIHSLHKVKLWSAVEPTGVQELSLDEENPAPAPTIKHPLHLLIWEEFGELNDTRTDSLIRKARRCDSLHKAAIDLSAAAERILACQAHAEVEDLECLIFDWLRWGGKRAAEADWELISNDFHILRPDIYVGACRKRVRKNMTIARKKGQKIMASFSTVDDSILEANLFAVDWMNDHAPFDVSPFCGPGLTLAREPADKLPELVSELAKFGLTLDEIRPRLLLVHRKSKDDACVAFLKDPNGELHRYDGIFHTATIKSGFSIFAPMAVFAFLRAGFGPTSTGLHQMVLRCRLPLNNCIHVCIEGHVKQRSGSSKWWFRYLTRLNAETETLMEGFAYRLERADDGTVYLVDFDKELVMAEAKRLARHHRRAAIDDIRNDLGEVIEWGVLTSFWRSCGWNVIPMYQMELMDSLEMTVEEEKTEKKVEANRKTEIKKDSDRKTAYAKIKPKRETDMMRKNHRRDPQSHHEIESADIRWRYGLETLTPEDVAWHRKYGKAAAAYAMGMALKRDPQKVKANLADWEGPVTVHHTHKPAKAQRIFDWLAALGVSDPEQAAAAQYELPSLGVLLYNEEQEQENMDVDFGLTWKEEDMMGNRMTIGLLKLVGIKTLPSQRRENGKQVWKRVIDPESVATMNKKTALMILRLIDPEKAREEWDALEARALALDTPMIAAPTAEETAAFLAALVGDEGFIILKAA